MAPLEVLVVSDHSYVNGGAPKLAIDSAIGLARGGCHVTFFAAVGPPDMRLAQAGVRVQCLNQHDLTSNPSRLDAAISGIWNTLAARALESAIQRLDPLNSIVHVHGWAKALSPSIGRVLAATPVRNIYTAHDFFLACPNGAFFNHGGGEICRLQPLSTTCLTTNCDSRHAAHKAWRVARQAVLWSAGGMPRNLKEIIVYSETAKRVLSSHLSRVARVHFLLNPVDVQQRSPVAVGENRSFVFVGRLAKEKGCELFAAAARKAGVPAVFVGEGDQRQAILSANPDAVITGWLPFPEIENWFSTARCLVFPSLWYETFGLVSYEALARGVPVLCGEWTAAAEGISDNVNGFLMRSNRPEEWASRLAEIAVADIQAVGRRAYDRYWSQPLTLERHVNGLITIYRKILGDAWRPAEQSP